MESTLKRRKVWPWVMLAAVIVVGALVAGYVVWGLSAAAERNQAWSDAIEFVEADSTPDLTAVTFASESLETCTQSELYTFERAITKELVAAGLGDVHYSISGPIIERNARDACAASKEDAYAVAVTETRTALVVFLNLIGAPDSATVSLDGLRALDGVQTSDLATNAGPVEMKARYHGSNGLNVTLIRSPESFNPTPWG